MTHEKNHAKRRRPDMQLLLFDDNPQILLALGSAFERYGIETKTASTIDDAMRLVDSDKFDAALLDWNEGESLPIFLALEDCQPMCSRLVLSGMTLKQSEYEGQLIDMWLVKPLDIDRIVLHLRDFHSGES